MEKLILHNTAQLTLLRAFLHSIPTNYYVQKIDILFDSSIGMHVRHVLEFYSCLLDGVQNACMINYDLRQRDIRLETDHHTASETIDQIINLLRNEGRVDTGLIIHSGVDEEDRMSHLSSFKRELLYLSEHTTHHMATIQMIAHLLAIAYVFPAGFGLAPSTINYRATAQ